MSTGPAGGDMSADLESRSDLVADGIGVMRVEAGCRGLNRPFTAIARPDCDGSRVT
jgi:hypothetical protein